MTDVLKHLYNACDPFRPATEEYYLDLAEARGSSALAQEFLRNLALSESSHSCYFLFSGHIGCGKSSELEQLKYALVRSTTPDAKYFPVLINVSEYLDDYDVTLTDILLAIVSELAAALRQDLGVDLKDTYFQKRIDEVKKYFLSDVEINEGDLALGDAKLKVQRLKKDVDARQQVRESLRPQMSTMLEEINTVFERARLDVRKAPVPGGEVRYQDIVLILDNLEKIRRFGTKEEGEPSQRELFVESYAQLTSLDTHVIYTVPLRLMRSSEGPQLHLRYGHSFVLPMVKVMERGTRKPFPKGIKCLRALLQKRLPEGVTLDDVFENNALDFLLTYSGGNVRTLMTFVQNACTYATSLPIPLTAAHQAVQQMVRTYSTSIPDSHWEKLARLEQSTDQMIPGGDAEYLVMLENLSVLEYRNGGNEDDPFAAAEPWYAVNPIVRELQKFKAAVSAPAATVPLPVAQQPPALLSPPTIPPVLPEIAQPIPKKASQS